ncbi:MAG TPA: class F sortase [Propionibacteriaceae bacterium]
MTGRRGTRAAGLFVLAALAVTALAGCAAPAVNPGAAPTPVVAAATPSTAPSPKASGRGPQPLPTDATVKVTSVTIASIDVRTTRLETLPLLSDGSLAAPKNPDRAGWYADGTVPGQVGPAVIAGHVDSKTGPAVFYDLKQVKRGQKILVALSDGTTTTFTVDRVLTTPKKGFPTDEVFGPTPDAQLRLITCGGPYDRTVGSYVDNTVVFATATL